MPLSKPLSQPPQFKLRHLSHSALTFGFVLVSGATQAAICDYQPDQPADPQINQCQSGASQAVGAAQSELARAAFDTGFMLETAKLTPNLELSARYYQIAADLGSPGAQYNLANQIVRGGGDMSEAAKYYRMAAKKGAKLAQFNLATQYLTGQGVTQDAQKAYLWFRTAAGLGLAAAQFELASMFEKGVGVEKNLTSATGWYELAAEQGYAPAEQHLSDLKKNLTTEPERPKGLFGGLLIPRTPRQTLSFDLSDYPASDDKPMADLGDSAVQTALAGSTEDSNETHEDNFFSDLIKPRNRGNRHEFVYTAPENSDQTAEGTTPSSTSSPKEVTQTAVEEVSQAALVGSQQPSSKTTQPSAALQRPPLLTESEQDDAPVQLDPTQDTQPIASIQGSSEQALSTKAQSDQLIVEEVLIDVTAPINVTPDPIADSAESMVATEDQSTQTPKLSEDLAGATPPVKAGEPDADTALQTEAATPQPSAEQTELTNPPPDQELAAASKEVIDEVAIESPNSNAVSQPESAAGNPILAEPSSEPDLSAEKTPSDEPPAELAAAKILTSALPAADLPQSDINLTQAQDEATPEPDDPAYEPSSNSLSLSTDTLSTDQQLSAPATPIALEAAPEQVLAANVQSPEELEAILENLPSYQVERPDFPAEKAYLRAAESGSEMAQLALANAYAQGKGVPADSEAAAKWYLRAARQGNADASLNLALSYKLGNGLKKSNEKALKWFKHSAFRGNAQALYNLGAIYATGTGTSIDETLAARYFSQSASLGYEPAKNALEFLNR